MENKLRGIELIAIIGIIVTVVNTIVTIACTIASLINNNQKSNRHDQ